MGLNWQELAILKPLFKFIIVHDLLLEHVCSGFW